MKCKVCKVLKLDSFKYKLGNRVLEIPRAELFDNDQRGCEMCGIIIKAIELSREPFPSILDKYMPALRVSEYEPGYLAIAYLTTSSNEDSKSRCHIHTVAGSPASLKWPQIGSRASIDQNAVSEETLDRASSWLRDCIEKHPDCGAVEEVELPTRLIKLGSNNDNVQLVITQGMQGKYATLSHCWGPPGRPRPLTTTGPTINERMAGVSFHDLPQTFQDAIVVTRGLGLNYL
ncbi:hypothetical protein DL95DRAFT_469256 [Leptodontidium sp. 2 PMI_412]|nr:hypothetical protein DL95DRAFT_469256 [Leptodontidium sp. 2 PMI_412]